MSLLYYVLTTILIVVSNRIVEVEHQTFIMFFEQSPPLSPLLQITLYDRFWTITAWYFGAQHFTETYNYDMSDDISN